MKRFCALLLASYLLFSCEVSTVKSVDLPVTPERLVVIGLATNLGIGVYVSKTFPVLVPKEEAPLLDAEVSLLRGATTVIDLKKSSNIYLSDSAWSYTPEYMLHVKHPMLGEASARLEPLPEKVYIQEAIATSGEDESEADISFTFQDRSGHDYYAYQVVPLVGGKPYPLANLSLYEINPGSVFNDLGFENQDKTIKTRLTHTFRSTNGETLTASQFRIYLYHLSKGTYEYYRSLREYDSYNEDTFAGALLVANNIMNGYGFVGSGYVDSLNVSLK